jgi:hypothetical protein
MKKLCSTFEATECIMYKSILESNGIESILKNELLSPLAGCIPFNDVQPELWVREEDVERATEIISAASQAAEELKTNAKK